MYDKKAILAASPTLSDVQIYEKIPSTMEQARNGAENGAKTRTLYLAQEQTQTRGRFRRPYFADKEGGIYMSLLLLPHERSEDCPQYTLLTAVAIVKAIEKLTDKKPVIKWVNDLYLDGKKLCGILSEASVSAQDKRYKWVLVGVGLNFAIKQFPDSLQGKAISLFPDMEHAPFSREVLIAEIWTQFAYWERRDYHAAYKEYCFVLGESITFEINGDTLSGVAVDLSKTGELLVKISDNQTLLLSSGDISLKKIGTRAYQK